MALSTSISIIMAANTGGSIDDKHYKRRKADLEDSLYKLYDKFGQSNCPMRQLSCFPGVGYQVKKVNIIAGVLKYFNMI